MDLKEFQGNIDKCISHLKEELSQINTGRANPELIQDLEIDAYNTKTPLKAIANISVSDARSLVVQPWDKTYVESIDAAVRNAGLGLSPVIEGDHVRVSIPDLTEERRNEYVKLMKERIEDGRVAVRQVRQNTMQEVDLYQEEGLSEDDADRLRVEVEKVVKETNQMIEEIKEKKEQDLLKI
jgi:ribosome recycling factor